MLALLLIAATQIPYLIRDRVILTPTTSEKNVVTADALIESFAVSPQGRRLAFWCESFEGPVTTCFAQQFAADDFTEIGATRVFEPQPGDPERSFSRSGSALWINDDEALLLIAARQEKQGNQLLVQHWRRGKVSEPALVSNAIELGFWESLVRLPSGEIYAVWQEEKRAFSICARRISNDGKAEGPILKLQKVFELATPGSISVAATLRGICLTWSEEHRHHPTVYFAQFDRDGQRVGEPQIVFDDLEVDDPHVAIGRNEQVFVEALKPDENIVLRPLGGEVTTIAADTRHGNVRMAINDTGEPAVAWKTPDGTVWIRGGGKAQQIETTIEPRFLSLQPRGTGWRVYFRKLPEKATSRYMWLTYAGYNANNGN
ncbi:MAG TPA: hypothetical protein VJ901_07260 [Thermoanaerobaculia bacterium]|nr:hypothetical protein [Thermoanaerobaculia bacterium]